MPPKRASNPNTPVFSEKETSQIEAVGGEVNENGYAVFEPAVLQKLVGPKQFESMMAKAVENASGDSVTWKSLLTGTWNASAFGKGVIVLAGIGFIFVGSVATEGGAVGLFNVQFRPATAIMNVLLPS